MSDIEIRRSGAAGRITLTRPQALNALTPAMCAAIKVALDDWRDDPAVALVILDAEGPRAFCAGGDISEIHEALSRRDYAMPRGFWRDEYRMNLTVARYPKPVVAFLQGFTMGGGVGLGCHASHRVVGASSRIAMPECTIGLIPDVGGTHLLGRAPGRLGEFLGLTGARLEPDDAIDAGFADHFLSEAQWPGLIAHLEREGDVDALRLAAGPPSHGRFSSGRGLIDEVFAARDLAGIAEQIDILDDDIAEITRSAFARNAPLAMASALLAIRDGRANPGLVPAFAREYRYAWRAAEQGDFLEGIRARIIDKDNAPAWAHSSPQKVPAPLAAAMLAPLGADEWVP